MNNKNYTRVFKMSFAGVYPHYIEKVEKKGRTKEDEDVLNKCAISAMAHQRGALAITRYCQIGRASCRERV